MLQNYKNAPNGTKNLDNSTLFIDKRENILNKLCCIEGIFSLIICHDEEKRLSLPTNHKNKT